MAESVSGHPQPVPEIPPERSEAVGGDAARFAELERARHLLAAVVESSDDAILTKDLDGRITSWNAGAERIYGYAAAEVIGKHVSLLVPPDLHNDVPDLMRRLRSGERIRHYETVRMARDGRRLHVSLTISAIRDDAGRVTGASAIGRDITDRKQEQGRWRLLSELGERLSQVLDGEQLLRELAKLLTRDLADYCVTYLVEADGRIRRVGTAHVDPERESLVRQLVELVPPTREDAFGAGAVIRTGEPILAPYIPPDLLDRISDVPEYVRLLHALGPVSSMVLPLRARGRMLGAVALANTRRSGWHYGEVDLALGRELAERAALALDNARLFGEARAEVLRRQYAERGLRRRFEQLRVLYEISEALGRAGAVEEIYERSLDGLRDALDVHRASILLFDGDRVARFKAWRGLSEGYRHAVEGHTPWPPDARDPDPVRVPDVRADLSLDPALRDVVLREGIRAMAFVPLTFGGRLLGKFMLYFDAPRALEDDEMELARTIARSVAVAITRMRDELSVREAKEGAERASHAKSQFLGVMSHELRTPLNAVLGFTELLMMEIRGPLTDGQREQLGRIQASARHQLELIEELLTYTRLEAGRETPRVMRTDARRVIADVVELVRPEADRKGLRLRADLGAAPLEMATDPARLRQILLNLAANAAKYTDLGEVCIAARCDLDHLVVVVADTGCGIPADKLDYIFEPFSRVDETRTRMTSGTGLGLAIARGLAIRLGGDVAVRSTPGRGSTFVLRLPLEIDPLPPD